MSEWWKPFYEGAWVEVQRRIRTPEENQLHAEQVIGLLDLAPGARLLDIPCGTGRIATPLAERGFAVTGIDQSAKLLADAQKARDERGLTIEYVQQDMREIEYHAKFDAAICLWGSFGYFNDAGNRRFCQANARALVTGGKFLVEAYTTETLLPRYHPRSWHRVGDITVLEQRSLDFTRGRIDTEWMFILGDGKIEKCTSSVRLYTCRELCHLLSDVGFGAFKMYATLAGEPFDVGARRLVIVATKATELPHHPADRSR